MGTKQDDFDRVADAELVESMTSHTPQPPAGDDLVARDIEVLRNFWAIEMQHALMTNEPLKSSYIERANSLSRIIEALTSQQPTKVYVAVDHTGCIYECEDEDRVIRTAQSAFKTAVARAQREIEELMRERSDICAAIGSPRWMDPPDGGDVSLAEQVRRMRAELEALGE